MRWADEVIADRRGIQTDCAPTFGSRPGFIPYGAPSPRRRGRRPALAAHGLEPGGYHLVVARFEPENHVLEIVEGYAAARRSSRSSWWASRGVRRRVHAPVVRAAARDTAVRLLGAVWDQRPARPLYAGAATYVHGHSVGGTNPSLLRAMAPSTPVIA